MSTASTSRSHVSFDTDEDTHIGSSSSSPIAENGFNHALVASSSSPIRNEVLPLGPSRTIPALSKRGVIFSPRTDTKYFHTDDLILPSPINHSTPKPPSSFRSYSDPVTPFDSPSKSKAKGRTISDTPTLVRSILKSRMAQQIRLAATVEEGTLNNKEAARLLVSGKRPKLLARDSFQLAQLRNAASNSQEDRKGKGKMQDIEIPSSDDSNVSNSSDIPNHVSSEPDEDMLIDNGGNSSEEEEETIEEDGALSTASLVNIILDGAEDLLTLEEAYSTLTLRLRTRIPIENELIEALSPAQIEDIRITTQPIKDEAPAMVRAIQRDLQRLLGKLPNNDLVSSDIEMTPFRGLMPLRDDTLTTQRGRFTPSPTPVAGTKSSSSPTKSARQGYTESEVRYRREASGVGAAVLRFLAFTFHTSHLFSCYSEADLQSLLETVMIIPRTPKLPTPNPKRTYYLSIVILAQMNLPSACVQPVKDKVVRAVEGAMADTLGSMGGVSSGKEGPSAIKKEGFHAVTNLVSNYPSILFPHYVDLLAGCLKAMVNPSNLIRCKAGSAISAFARAKFTLLANTQNALVEDPTNPTNKENWLTAKTLISKSEFFVVSHLKSSLKLPGKSVPIYGKDGEKRIEWHSLEQVFKDTVGSTTDVHWACAAWSLIVTLMGSAYASSGLASGFDHIMDRSLQPSTNTVRPLLARAAWNHAIHSYLSAGFASSVSVEGRLIRSYKPFASSSQQSIEQRTANIQFPVNLALSKATDKASYARGLTNARSGTESHYVWQRSEKSKKLQWLITCGLGSTAVVYAHTGMALYHEDQPAKEMSQISGLPSSDGIVIPDLTPEETKLPRLDNAWEKVVNPMLNSFFAICGVDKLTIHGWKILEAITSSPITENEFGSEWNLDKLLVPRYMSGEVFSKDKESDFTDLLDDIQDDELQPYDIPSWGHFWAAKRLGRLLSLFDEALSSIHGLNDTSNVDWITNENGLPLIPSSLSNIWRNLLLALKSAKIAQAPPTPLFLVGLQTVTKQLVQIFYRDPKTYVPISKINEKGQCLLDEDELRIRLFTHLFEVMSQILGEDILGATRLRTDQISSSLEQPTTDIFHNAFGGDSSGHPTVSGTLLGQLLRSKIPANTAVKQGFTYLISMILDIGSAPGYAGKLLGDITNAMPFLFEDREEIQLDIWRLLATKWTQIVDLQPSSTTSSTNHTGALLVSLLSGPFRGRSITSYWHQNANETDLEIWQNLLEVTVLRFRAKRFGSNCGVLEALSGHLEDFLVDNDKTKSSTITLSCLSSAISWISFNVPEGQSSHSQNEPDWHISDENFVPKEFLNLVNSALLEAYPSPTSTSNQNTQEQEESTMTEISISPAVFDLLDSFVKVLKDTPKQFVGKVLEPVKKGVALWLEDPERVVDEDNSQRLDNLYVTLLTILSSTMPSEDLPIDSETLNTLAELYIPRISKGNSSAVPLAFQSFWNNTFGTGSSEALQYSEDVAYFLRDLLTAVPGMINCPGLEGSSQLSEEESLGKFPHIQATQLRPSPSVETEVQAVENPIPEPIVVEMTNPEYDADISQSIEQTQLRAQPEEPLPEFEVEPEHEHEHEQNDDVLVDATKDDITIPSSPVKIAPEADNNVESEDVFGPAAMTDISKNKKRRAGGRRGKGQNKAKAKTQHNEDVVEETDIGEDIMDIQSLPEITRVKVEGPTNSRSLPDFATPLVEDSDNEDCIVVVPSPGFYRRRGMKQPVPVDENTEEAQDKEMAVVPDSVTDDLLNDTSIVHDIPVANMEPRLEEPQDVSHDDIEQELEVEPTQQLNDDVNHRQQISLASSSKDSPSRPSLLTSASRWLSRVHSLPFFSPSTTSTSSPAPVLPPATQPEPELEAENDNSSIIELSENSNEDQDIQPEEVVTTVKAADASVTTAITETKARRGKKSKRRRGSAVNVDIPTSTQELSQDKIQEPEPVPEPEPAVAAEVIQPIKSKSTLTKSQSTDSIVSTISTRGKSKRKAIELETQSVGFVIPENLAGDQQANEVESEPRRSKRRRQKSSNNSTPSSSPNKSQLQSQTHSNKIKDVSMTRPETEPKRERMIMDNEEEEDELLLSPESARRRKREEEEEVFRASQSQSQSPNKRWSESISGRFDDAIEIEDISNIPFNRQKTLSRPSLQRTPSSPSPKSKSKSKSKSRIRSTRSSSILLEEEKEKEKDIIKSRPLPPSIYSSLKGKSNKGENVPRQSTPESTPPPTSPQPQSSPLALASSSKITETTITTSPLKRTSQQKNLIKMLDDAVKTKQIIENLDYQGVKSLLKNLNTLREAAEETMLSKLEDYRNEKRK
ncbi:uncharacterized protein L201_003429 [Kwoniella dendrophila CBS 6074]|uniref:Telomere-associated protein Rif1 N-terminal domain-containing protein n=1 Tax=Kwoniella dendrophila CBS 6074 TaxID=1295534 RepID=A0AAX4JUF4_9TREE